MKPSPTLIVAALALWPATAFAQNAAQPHLGGGGSLDISLGRIIASLVICIIIAVLAILLIRQRGGRGDLAAMFARIQPRARAIEVVETRRLSPHADICLVRHGGRDYLVVVQQGSMQLLREEPTPSGGHVVRLTGPVPYAAAAGLILSAAPAVAAPAHGLGMPSDVIRTTLILTLLAVIPSVLICMTSFVRIIVVLSMVRHAFGMPETPPSPVLASLALFLTAFTMAPTLGAVNTAAVQPLLANKIGVEEAIAKGKVPFRDFMLAQTKDSDIEAIYAISHTPPPTRPDQVDILKLAPAFMLNELRVSFTIGFVILLPFLLIDLVVSAILLSLGMMMVPPATISLPIKLLMFVLIDGWGLIIQGVLGSFK